MSAIIITDVIMYITVITLKGRGGLNWGRGGLEEQVRWLRTEPERGGPSRAPFPGPGPHTGASKGGSWWEGVRRAQGSRLRLA